MMTMAATARSVGQSALARALDRYLQPGTRGQKVSSTVEDTTWTRSAITLRVEANDRFAELDPAQPPSTREYTLAHFQLKPYLPEDRSTALYKVLEQADRLATRSVADGVPYKQHDWKAATDDLNLLKGIDCSRAIWFAFTRAGLPYNRDDSYLATAAMVGAQSRMADRFDACAGPPQTGDVLVYRDDARGTGHVVMVIDYGKRIGWGSHGWDGNATADQPAGDTGVEYQLIKYKADWERWDRPTMERKACWRYRGFADERARGAAMPVSLEHACDEPGCGS